MSQISSDVRTRAPDALDNRGRMILALLLGVQFLIALDFSTLNVALPTIGADVGFSLGNLQWVVTLFALAATGFTLFFGRVADIAGRRRVFMIGTAFLGLASAMGAAAQTPTVLLLARVLQGLATATLIPSGLALLITSFPEGPLRAKALGLNGALLSAGFTAGALIGGLLTGLLNWRWAFIINVPVCLLALLMTPLLITDSRPAQRPRLDLPGALTVTGGLLALVYGVTSIGHYGLTDSRALWSLAAAVVLLGGFWVIEQRAPEPLVAVSVLTRPGVLWGNIGGLVTFTMFTAQVFLLTIYLQKVLSYSPLQTGLTFTVLGTTAFLAGLLAPRLIALFGNSRRSMLVSLVIQAVMTGTLYLLSDAASALWLVVGSTAIGGFFHCLAVVSFMVTSTSGLPDQVQGLATSLASMTQQIGITLGIPIMSAVATSQMIASQGGPNGPAAVLHGVTFALGVDAMVVVFGALLIGVFLRPSLRPAPANTEAGALS